MPSIRKRGANYQVTVSLGRDSQGKQILKTTTFEPDSSLTARQQENTAKQFAFEYEQKLQSGKVVKDSKITTESFCKQWLAEYAKPQLTVGTYEKTEAVILQQIIPQLGSIRLVDLKKITIVRWINQLASDQCKRYDGKIGPYKKATINRYYGILHSILQTAIDWEYLTENPSDNVNLPKDHSTSAHKKIKFLTFAQVTSLLNFMQTPYEITVGEHTRVDDTGLAYHVPCYKSQHQFTLQDRIIVHLTIDSGLRKQELLGLCWNAIDFDTQKISIHQAVSSTKAGEILKSLKNSSSERSLTIGHKSIQLLKQWKAEQETLMQQTQGDFNPEGWVFIRANGLRMNYSTPYQIVQKVIHHYNESNQATPMPSVGIHGLRHTCATLLLAAGIDIREVAARLGHAETSTALDVYIHALPSSDKAAADKMDMILATDDKS